VIRAVLNSNVAANALQGYDADVKRLCLCFLLLSATATVSVAAQQKPHTRITPKLTTLRDLSRYVGTYPCSNGLLKQPVLLQSLRKILGQDYQAYREHMRFSGCGAIERRNGFLLLDVSQLHVGGYESLMFVSESDGALFLFWLKSTVKQKDYAFYGARPIPVEVSRAVESELNTGWGHVAKFTAHGDQLEIVMNP
jgi:hypothetical protein